jgi:hypothetical protein
MLTITAPAVPDIRQARAWTVSSGGQGYQWGLTAVVV